MQLCWINFFFKILVLKNKKMRQNYISLLYYQNNNSLSSLDICVLEPVSVID